MNNSHSDEDAIKTLTVDEVIAQLSKYPHDTKVYLSQDPEGNGYASILGNFIENNSLDKAICLYPNVPYLEWEDIFPLTAEAEEDEDE